jgi:hypothetical protein
MREVMSQTHEILSATDVAAVTGGNNKCEQIAAADRAITLAGGPFIATGMLLDGARKRERCPPSWLRPRARRE